MIISGCATTASHGPVSINLWTVSFVDTSINVSGTVTVNWGDGNVDYANAGSTFTHTYVRASSYRILHTVNKATSPDTFIVSVPQTFTVSGIVTDKTGSPLSGVTIALKIIGHTRQVATTKSDGSFLFTVKSGFTYTIGLYKKGYTFNTVTVPNLSSNLTLTISAN